MQSVVFICLLSLSLCFSAPSDTHVDGAGSPVATGIEQHLTTLIPKDPKQASEASGAQTSAPSGTPAGLPDNDKTPKGTEGSKSTLPDAHKIDESGSSHKEESTKSNSASVAPSGNNTPKSSTTAETQAPPSNSSSTTSPTTASTTQKPPITSSSAPTTASPPTSSSTTPAGTTPHAATTKSPPLAARSFDAGSFVGGIVLALGMVAIGVIGFKYYKSQTERNYHTL